jgi:hypothetical protein
LITLVFFASPLVLRHAFSFMTDVPFIALCTLALVAYARGLKSGTVPAMLVGGLFSAAAVLTRQFGVAFIPALGLVWASSANRRGRFPLVMIGAVPPLVAGVWQFRQGMEQQAWTAQWRSAEQIEFLASPTLVMELLWRVVVVPVHLALYALPLVVVAVLMRSSDQSRPRWVSLTGGPIGIGFLIVCTLTLWAGARSLGRPFIMPLTEWNLAPIASWPAPLPALLTAILLLLAGWLCSATVRRYTETTRAPVDAGEKLLDIFTLFLLAVQLIYVQFSDRYLLVLLPYVLIVVGREISSRGVPHAYVLQRGLALTLVMLTVSAAWERDTLARAEALWKGGEWLRVQGVSPEQIHSESWEWEYYQGSFDRWLASQPDPTAADFNDFFDRFWPEAWRNARYLVTVREFGQSSAAQGRLLLAIPYRDLVLRQRFVDVTDLRADSSARATPRFVD